MLIGIIGKANVGKSTFFNAATELAVQAANYPFTTINSNIGIVHARQKLAFKTIQFIQYA
jgi:ribosome-binding ATPase YchF (GTP1/OBG family)